MMALPEIEPRLAAVLALLEARFTSADPLVASSRDAFNAGRTLAALPADPRLVLSLFHDMSNGIYEPVGADYFEGKCVPAVSTMAGYIQGHLDRAERTNPQPVVSAVNATLRLLRDIRTDLLSRPVPNNDHQRKRICIIENIVEITYAAQGKFRTESPFAAAIGGVTRHHQVRNSR